MIYYEIKNKDLKKYKKEFKSTTFGQKDNWFVALGGILFVIGYIVFFVSTLIEGDLGDVISSISFDLMLISLIISGLAEIIGYFVFLRWLKLKHKIEF